MKISNTLVGVAGEYFVAAELSRRGWVASVTMRNTAGIDVLATHPNGSHSVTIQCKTSGGKSKKWLLDKKAETFVAENHYYVFVVLGGCDERPHFHVVPSDVVAEFVRESHARWLATPSRDGVRHKDNNMRNFRDPHDKFLDQWTLLGEPVADFTKETAAA